MGLWGAAQGVAFGLGGLVGTAASDLARLLFASPGVAYGCVFAVEGLMFLLAARLAAGSASTTPAARPARIAAANQPGMSG